MWKWTRQDVERHGCELIRTLRKILESLGVMASVQFERKIG